MPKTDLLDINGKKVGTINLPPEIFAAEVNPPLMAQAVRVYLANQRKAHPKTKTRAEVNRTKAKWYRQKGTGRARHGSRAAPIFVGGGVAHGPTGEQNYQLKMPKKMKKAALFSALTSKFKEKEILVVKGLEKIEPKPKKWQK
jgi:LSU ribosomal protein L4P